MGGVPVWVGFEYMAQAIAALSGRQGARHSQTPKIGFIMGIREFDCRIGVFAGGTCLRVEVAQEFRDGPVVSFHCRILDAARDGMVLTSAMVNAIEVDDTELNKFSEACNG
jgi:predicted hotdog family 3-hydroxylacyl-ACP dehydratase